jgi:hypothetical protein
MKYNKALHIWSHNQDDYAMEAGGGGGGGGGGVRGAGCINHKREADADPVNDYIVRVTICTDIK